MTPYPEFVLSRNTRGPSNVTPYPEFVLSRNTRGPSNVTPYPEFVLTNIICIEEALKGTEIVFVLTENSY